MRRRAGSPRRTESLSSDQGWWGAGGWLEVRRKARLKSRAEMARGRAAGKLRGRQGDEIMDRRSLRRRGEGAGFMGPWIVLAGQGLAGHVHYRPVHSADDKGGLATFLQ